ncbi:MAG TPA: hypothetical protein PK239_02375 [Chitinophagales bacterium]|nr:hypothetical protein [Chitinophagales bacterium]
MIPDIREAYNRSFSEELYRLFLADVNNAYQFPVSFRIAESPVFIPHQLKRHIFAACDEIIDFITSYNIKTLCADAVPPHLNVPNEDEHTLFLGIDFAICRAESGELVPQLIELQGFPSLFAYQDFLTAKYRQHFTVPDNYTHLFSGLTPETYRERLKNILLGNHQPENVILLEVEPLKQNTAIDFIVTEHYTGIKPVCVTEVIRQGRKLFYLRNGVKTPIYRIYNRVIFDEFMQRTDLQCQFNLTEEVDVEWAGHPNWFLRISKFMMPFMKSVYIPQCTLLNDFTTFPPDLDNYVLKPLFSFSGSGVVFHPTQADIDAIPLEERKNYMLQKKVKYEPVVQAPDGLVKTEIRIMYFWEPHLARPEKVISLARFSRADLIGVKYNKNKTWVGGSVALFPQD